MYIWFILIIVIILGLIAFYFMKVKNKNTQEMNISESISLIKPYLNKINTDNLQINKVNSLIKNYPKINTKLTNKNLNGPNGKFLTDKSTMDSSQISLKDMSLDDVETKYGLKARKIVNCVRQWPEGGGKLHACVVSGRDWWCKAEGLQWEESCNNCGVNLMECYSMSLLYDRLRKDGLIPNYF